MPVQFHQVFFFALQLGNSLRQRALLNLVRLLHLLQLLLVDSFFSFNLRFQFLNPFRILFNPCLCILELVLQLLNLDLKLFSLGLKLFIRVLDAFHVKLQLLLYANMFANI